MAAKLAGDVLFSGLLSSNDQYLIYRDFYCTLILIFCFL